MDTSESSFSSTSSHSIGDDSDLDSMESSSSSSTDSDLILTAVAVCESLRPPRDPSIAMQRSTLRQQRQEATLQADATLYPAQFKRTFRMSASRFERLFQILGSRLEPKLPRNAIVGRARTGSAVINALVKMQISLRILAGASYLDLARVHNVCPQTVYNAFTDFFSIVSSGDHPELRIAFPTQVHELQAKADRFQTLTGNRPELYGCVGALDGLAIRIKRPSTRWVPNVLAYCGRSKTFTMNMQAICDADLRLIWVSLETPGATHDNTAFSGTDFSTSWHTMDSTYPFWIAADDAYSLRHNLLTPWPGRGLLHDAEDGIWKDSFNYSFSAGNRSTIERAFGVLVARFGILWRPIQFHLEDVPRIVLCACVLHNFCLDGDDESIPLLGTGPGARRRSEVITEDGLYFDIIHISDYISRDPSQRPRGRERCEKRDAMTQALKANGITRPRHLS